MDPSWECEVLEVIFALQIFSPTLLEVDSGAGHEDLEEDRSVPTKKGPNPTTQRPGTPWGRWYYVVVVIFSHVFSQILHYLG